MPGLAYDVVIIGGGVVGTSAGITLLQREGLKVAIIEKADFDNYRIGESLSPGARPLLEYLKVWNRFEKEQSLTSYGSHGAWSSEESVAFDFLFTTHGPGWSLDRIRFDQMLFETFVERGGSTFLKSTFKKASHNNGKWTIELSDENELLSNITTQFILDATGRQGVFSKHMKATRIVYDRLIGVGNVGKIPSSLKVSANVMVEACEYGWWYSAPVPEGQVATVLMTDSDIASKLNCTDSSDWKRLLEAMPLTSERVKGVVFDKAPKAYAAYSSVLTEPGGEGWLAVGDAVASHDPLSSSGIPHAMGSGIQGAIVALNELSGRKDAYKAFDEGIQKDFIQYLKTHWQYYSMVERWPNALFWKRRTTSIKIDPQAVIGSIGSVESLSEFGTTHLSKKGVIDLLETCKRGQVVHETIRGFKKAHPQYPDQQLILSFQELVENELIELV
ncbi:tryptophan 7-halogenase [Roseivirga sp. E12]|uniref:tryptophan 7-halogenase n=1 Tax=Roseivirga sp. E12 TaxID=2819237 RepID=UPI001ABC2185|nr:tryptophan 7-halogenase [Roseivirga sp. E12]MBO3698398.1 tryptophan 7-halogenase [Roseivirga sp. E12]